MVKHYVQGNLQKEVFDWGLVHSFRGWVSLWAPRWGALGLAGRHGTGTVAKSLHADPQRAAERGKATPPNPPFTVYQNVWAILIQTTTALNSKIISCLHKSYYKKNNSTQWGAGSQYIDMPLSSRARRFILALRSSMSEKQAEGDTVVAVVAYQWQSILKHLCDVS